MGNFCSVGAAGGARMRHPEARRFRQPREGSCADRPRCCPPGPILRFSIFKSSKIFPMPTQTLATSLPTLEEIKSAQQHVYAVMQPTPQYTWPLLCARMGTEVWVKHENHSPIGAFKARTALVYVAELFRETSGVSGLVTATRGNHGQSVALAARRFGVIAHVVVPRGNSAEKNAAMRAQG